MPAEVYEDTLELTVGILEAVLPDSGQYLTSAYPYPSLKSTGRTETRTFRTVVLENPFLRVTIVPDLGGRILRIFDKRTNADVFSDEKLITEEGGSRGVELPHGIQIRYNYSDRPNAIATVDYQLVLPDEDFDDAGVWIGEVGVGLSFNALISIPPEKAEINIEARLFNRLLANTPYNGGITIGFAGAKSYLSSIHAKSNDRGFVLYSKSRNAGVSIWPDDASTLAVHHSDDRLTLHRFGAKTRFTLGPRSLDTMRFKIVAHSGLGISPDVCPELGLDLGSKECAIQSSQRLRGGKFLVLTKDGQSFESPLELHPEHRKEISFSSVPSRVSEIAIMDSDRNVLLREIVGTRPAPLSLHKRNGNDSTASDEAKAKKQFEKLLATTPEFARSFSTVRYEAHILHAISEQRRKSNDVDSLIEQALIFNGEDHLAWCMKAVLKRIDEGPREESPELLNAHFLAPLEPALRAEGFLTQPPAQGKKGNPILKPLAESPEQFIDCACLLIDLALYSEASRFIDEAIRHEDLPMLRYLQASLLLNETRMTVEAAEQIAKANAKTFSPPFPWRRAEISALESLVSAFPNDDRIRQYLVASSLYTGPSPLI